MVLKHEIMTRNHHLQTMNTKNFLKIVWSITYTKTMQNWSRDCNFVNSIVCLSCVWDITNARSHKSTMNTEMIQLSTRLKVPRTCLYIWGWPYYQSRWSLMVGRAHWMRMRMISFLDIILGMACSDLVSYNLWSIVHILDWLGQP